MLRPLALVLTLVPLAACSPKQTSPPPAPSAATAPKYDLSLPMDELMGHVVDPASFAYWAGSGTEVTAKGERDLSPTTPEGWEKLENAAAILIEAGNLLQLPGRGREPAADWSRYAQELSARAIVAKAAAEKHDKRAVFDAGAKLYETCTSCHKEFVIDPGIKANPPIVRPFPEDAPPSGSVAANAAG